MMELDNAQIEFVQKHIKIRGIKTAHLEVDVLDHVCCIIEGQMQKGWSFKKSFLYTMRKFGPHGIQKIQDETTMAIGKAFFVLRIMHIGLNTIALVLALSFILGPIQLFVLTGSLLTTLAMIPFFALGALIINSFDFKRYEFANYN